MALSPDAARAGFDHRTQPASPAQRDSSEDLAIRDIRPDGRFVSELSVAVVLKFKSSVKQVVHCEARDANPVWKAVSYRSVHDEEAVAAIGKSGCSRATHLLIDEGPADPGFRDQVAAATREAGCGRETP